MAILTGSMLARIRAALGGGVGGASITAVSEAVTNTIALDNTGPYDLGDGGAFTVPAGRRALVQVEVTSAGTGTADVQSGGVDLFADSGGAIDLTQTGTSSVEWRGGNSDETPQLVSSSTDATVSVLVQLLEVSATDIHRTPVKVNTSVSGTLSADTHAGAFNELSGNVTIPQTVGFHCVLAATGAQTITFNATTTAALESGDTVAVFVKDATTIYAVRTPSAEFMSFS